MSSISNFADSFSYSLGKITGSVASIGLTIAQNITGGIEKYLAQNADRIKRYIVSMFDVGTEIADIAGELAQTFADIFSVFGGDTAQQISANLIGIFAEVNMMISETALKLGRDILNMIAQPIIDNKEKIKDALEGTLGAIEPFTTGLLEAVQTVSDAVTKIYDDHLKPLFDSVAQGLSDIFGKLLDGYNTYIVPVLENLGTKFQELMEGPFGETIGKIEMFIGNLIDAIKLLWDEVLAPFLGWIADNIMPVLAPIIELIGDTAINAIEAITIAIGNIADILSGLIDFFTGVFTGDWELAWEGIKEIAKGAWELITNVIKTAWERIQTATKGAITIIKTVVQTAWEGLKTLTSTIFDAIKNKIVEIFGAIKTWISDSVTNIKENANKAFDNLKSKIFSVLQSLLQEVTNKWDDIKQKFDDFRTFLSDAFQSAWSNTIEKLKTIIGNFATKIKTSLDNAKKRFGSIIDYVKGTFSDSWSTAWNNLKQIFSNVFNSLKGLIKKPINAVIKIVNSAINAINGAIGGVESALSFSIEIPIPFGEPKKIGYTANFPRVPTIPYLAKGAVIPPNAPFVSVMGDQKNGKNLEAPESLIRKIFREEINGSSRINGTIRIPVILDGRQVFEAVIDEAKMKQLVSGRNPFEMA